MSFAAEQTPYCLHLPDICSFFFYSFYFQFMVEQHKVSLFINIVEDALSCLINFIRIINEQNRWGVPCLGSV